MKRILSFVCILFLLPLTLFGAPKEQRLSLEDCYELALRQSETLRISQEEIKIASARFLQRLGLVLPRIGITYTEILQDTVNNTSDGEVGGTFTQFRRPQVGIGLTQSLFQGFREFYALKSSKISSAEKEYRKKDLERLLFGDVATAFFTVATLEAELNSTQKIRKIIKDRIGEIQERVKLGKSRDSEYASQAADLSMIEANYEKTKGDLLVAYELLGFLTGLTPQPAIRVDKLNIQVGKPEDWKNQLSHRGDLKAQDKLIDLAKENIKVQRSYLFPEIEVNSNYYLHRNGFQKDINWDTTFNIQVPLFNMATFGHIKEAKIKTKQEEIRKEELVRRSEKEVTTDYVNLKSSLEQLRKYKLAVKMAEISYQQQSADYRNSLVNNVEVLQSQRTWLQALQQAETAQVQVWANWAKLKMSSGKI